MEIVDEEWEVFRRAVLACVREANGIRKVEEMQIIKCREWWVVEVKLVVKEKREVYGQNLQGMSTSDWEIYKNKWKKIKRLV